MEYQLEFNFSTKEKVLDTKEKIDSLKERLEAATKEKFKQYDEAKRASWQEAKYIILD